MSINAWMSWSSGKDSAYALHKAQQSGGYKVRSLMTTVTSDYDRVSMHSTRRALLDLQSRALGIPLQILEIPRVCTNEFYEEIFSTAIRTAESQNIERILFGDLFLEEIRAYRERVLSPFALRAEFPIWGLNTKELARSMIREGFEAHVVCVDTSKVPPELAGHRFDDEFLEKLPDNVDPCGENGEFHTFVANAPNFLFPIPVERGELRVDGNFLFCDFLPVRGID